MRTQRGIGFHVRDDERLTRFGHHPKSWGICDLEGMGLDQPVFVNIKGLITARHCDAAHPGIDQHDIGRIVWNHVLHILQDAFHHLFEVESVADSRDDVTQRLGVDVRIAHHIDIVAH